MCLGENKVTDMVGRIIKGIFGRLLGGKKKAASNDEHADAQAHIKKGRQSYDAGEYELAEKHFRQALLLDSTYTRAYSDLGQALYKQGRTQEAVTYWQKIVDQEPGTEAADKARHRIAKVYKEKRAVSKWIDKHLDDD